jgi:hypothetical protein
LFTGRAEQIARNNADLQSHNRILASARCHMCYLRQDSDGATTQRGQAPDVARDY